MTKKQRRYAFLVLLALFLMLVVVLLMQVAELHAYKGNIAMLFPKGIIALKQRNLLFIVQALMLIIVFPVFFLFFIFSWKYRATNLNATYKPEWDDHKVAEFIWWGVPCVIVLVISIYTWVRTQELDPYKPLVSDVKPIKIQVVALQWKWLFIYPEEQIAVVNFFQFPEKTPVYFEITADAPMNSFWIPQLGGQIFAMPKMRTKLHLMADEAGEFRGCSANISGMGFAGMHFIAKASSQGDFDQWIQSVKQSTSSLNFDEYQQLAKPSENNPVATYLLKDEGLFDQIIMKFMMPPTPEKQIK